MKISTIIGGLLLALVPILYVFNPEFRSFLDGTVSAMIRGFEGILGEI